MRKNTIVSLLIMAMLMATFILLSGCQRQASVVSQNLSLEADSFNVTRRLTVINTRADDGNNAVLFQMTGNFSIDKETDGDLAIIGENDDGTYYKHFVYLTRDISYIVEDIGRNSVNKHKFEINFNPQMIIPIDFVTID